MTARCNGCGRDAATQAFRCIWPDNLVTLDRHCMECQRTWHAQLRALGARLEAITPLGPDGTQAVSQPLVELAV